MQKFGRYIGIAVSVCCQSFGIPARRQQKFAEVGFKCVGMRGLYMPWHKPPYRYALNQRKRPRDAKFFCLLAETIKSGGKHSLPTQLRDILTNMTIYCKIGLIIQRGLNTIVLSSGSAKK